MPWSNQNGGGRNGGGRGPWGQGPGGGDSGNNNQGNQPPDLDDLIRRGQDGLRNALPGGIGGIGFSMILVLLAFVWGLSGFYRVAQSEVGIELRFGKYSEQTTPGLRYHFPWPVETVIKPDVETTRTIAITADMGDASLMLTGDQNIADVSFTVLWRISDPKSYVFNVAEQEIVVRNTAESVMREIVGRNDIEGIITGGRAEIQAEAQQLLQDILDSYEAGVLVAEVKMGASYTHPDAREAYRDVEAAKQDRERLTNEADAYANRIVPEAEGEAIKIVQDAEAFKARVIAESQGEAERFISVYKEYKKAPDVTRRRLFLETMEQVMSGTNKVILDKDGSGVVPYLPLNELNKNKPSSN